MPPGPAPAAGAGAASGAGGISDRELMRRSQARQQARRETEAADTAKRAPRGMRKRATESEEPYREEYEAEERELENKRKPGRDRDRPAGGRGGVKVGGKQARLTNLARGRPVVAGGSPAEEGAGVLLGLLAYALLLAYIRYGPDGVRGWLAAKFLNRPYGPALRDAPPPPFPTKPSSPTPPSSAAAPSSSAGAPYPSARTVAVSS
ncbi:MAG: hypothetical protein ACJ72N_22060 [Labedaea sp.]